MADTIQYGMGQIRYVDNAYPPYMELVSTEKKEINVPISGTEAPYYKDVYIKPTENFSFDSNLSYLLHLDIPKNNNYDTTFLIKMIEHPELEKFSESVNYQKIKYISIPKMTASGNSSRVILFPTKKGTMIPLESSSDPNYDLNVKIAKNWDGISTLGVNEVGYRESDQAYFIKIGSQNYQIFNKHDALMPHSWLNEKTQSETVGFDIVFSPHSSQSQVSYNAIWLQMIRANFDMDIYENNIYGRTVDFDNFQCQLYILNNLIDGVTVQNPLSHIGVYGHPGLLMAIEGEEIKIGRSGYYELNNFDITSLAVAARNYNDRFTIDYQYKISTSG